MVSDLEIDELQERVAVVCGQLNVAHARLVDLIVEAIRSGAWEQPGVRSVEHWVLWQTGLSPERARQLVMIARRRDELPVSFEAFGNGELAIDQIGQVARYTAPHNDEEVCYLARQTTVQQLRSAMSRHRPAWKPVARPAADDDATLDSAAAAGIELTDGSPGDDGPGPEHPAGGESEGIGGDDEAASRSDSNPNAGVTDDGGRVGMFFDDEGRYHLHAECPTELGALIDQALRDARDALFAAGNKQATWMDALAEVCNRSLASIRSRSRADNYRVYIHLDATQLADAARTPRPASAASSEPNPRRAPLAAWVNAGHGLSDGARDHLCCDAIIRPLLYKGMRPLDLGRETRVVPNHVRRLILDRDRHCRFPGCTSTLHLDVHHLVHWLRFGPTDTYNLAALCTRHHVSLHRGEFSASGDADVRDGIVWRRDNGSVIVNCGTPVQPSEPLPDPPMDHGYRHPLGERFVTKYWQLNDSPEDRRRHADDAAAQRARTAEAEEDARRDRAAAAEQAAREAHRIAAAAVARRAARSSEAAA